MINSRAKRSEMQVNCSVCHRSRNAGLKIIERPIEETTNREVPTRCLLSKSASRKGGGGGRGSALASLSRVYLFRSHVPKCQPRDLRCPVARTRTSRYPLISRHRESSIALYPPCSRSLHSPFVYYRFPGYVPVKPYFGPPRSFNELMPIGARGIIRVSHFCGICPAFAPLHPCGRLPRMVLAADDPLSNDGQRSRGAGSI
jgi:hypothetical protein